MPVEAPATLRAMELLMRLNTTLREPVFAAPGSAEREAITVHVLALMTTIDAAGERIVAATRLLAA